ncbi:hypothetical protein ACN47E_002095 [Coniothyrium glycines]
MHREPPPEGADNNTRPFVIFFGYLATCLGLAVFIVSRLFKKSLQPPKSSVALLPPKRHVYLFSALAASSLLTTWTHMFRYFSVSYQIWLMWRSHYELKPHQKHWGLWLKETSLFREAWETVIIGNARYWWSHQIFFFALGLGLYLDQKGVRRGIKYTWVFMLLGQIVAISFATNLFFLTLLFTPPIRSQPTSALQQRTWLGPWLINLVAILATAYPAMLLADEHYWHHPTAFMPVLLAPHVALLLLPLARIVIPEKYLVESVPFVNKVYTYLWALVLGNASLMLAWTTVTAYSYGGFQSVIHALHEHPAVSSVGYDVIFCWISWLSWFMTEGVGTKRNPTVHEDDMTSVPKQHVSSTVVNTSGYDNIVRRR